jgi:hypothetical protein
MKAKNTEDRPKKKTREKACFRLPHDTMERIRYISGSVGISQSDVIVLSIMLTCDKDVKQLLFTRNGEENGKETENPSRAEPPSNHGDSF